MITDSRIVRQIETKADTDDDSWRGVHRRPRRNRPPYARRTILALAAVIAIGGLSPLPRGTGIPPAQATAHVTAEAAPRSVMPASRAVRAVPTRAQKINKVINYALAQRGDRYKFGAMGPSKWDCSGLVKRSFAQIGINLPHYTGSMLKRGKHVSRKQLKRGDLVFPSKHHVGIYLGGGKMIVASSGHRKVMVQKVYSFYAARRLL